MTEDAQSPQTARFHDIDRDKISALKKYLWLRLMNPGAFEQIKALKNPLVFLNLYLYFSVSK